MLAINGSIITAADHTPLVLTEKIDPGFYTVEFNQKDSYFFSYPIPAYTLPKKIYGSTSTNNERITNTVSSRLLQGKGTSVLLRGVKGSGKTLTLKQLALQHVANGGIVLQVSQAFFGEGFVTFLNAFRSNHVMLVFDEFEKVYNKKEEMQGLLSLLDGTSTLPLFTALTCNKVTSDMEYFINRPGRIYFKLDYSGLESNVIEDYCNQELTNTDFTTILLDYSLQFNAFTLDMLSVLVTELNVAVQMNKYRGKPIDLIFTEVIKVLNIQPDRTPAVIVNKVLYKGVDLTEHYIGAAVEGIISNDGTFYLRSISGKPVEELKSKYAGIFAPDDRILGKIAHREYDSILTQQGSVTVVDSTTLFIKYKDFEITAKKLPFVSQNTDLNAFFNKQIESTNNEEDE